MVQSVYACVCIYDSKLLLNSITIIINIYAISRGRDKCYWWQYILSDLQLGAQQTNKQTDRKVRNNDTQNIENLSCAF